MTRNLRTLVLALAALTLVIVPATSLAKRRGHQAQTAPQSVGSIVSFADGVLAIEVGDGATISGRVTDRTRLGCSRGASGERRHGITPMARAAHRGRDEKRGATGATGATGPSQNALRTWGHVRRACDASLLQAGAKVLAASLVLTADGPVWRLVVLPMPVPAGPTGATGATGAS